MTSRSILFLFIFLLGASEPAINSAEAQLGFRPSRQFDILRQQELRQRYRPTIHVSRGPGGSRIFRSGSSIPFEYRTRQGFVSKIEVRSGLKVIKTIYPTPSASGRGRFTLTTSDFARAGKTGSKLKFKLWAWQGRNSRQSIHGESISYTLTP